MADFAHQTTSHGDMDHGFAGIDPSFVIAHEAAPACNLAEGSLDDRTAGQHYAGRGIDAAHHDCVEGDNAGARAGFAPRPLAIEHQGDVVDRAKQHQPCKVPEPPVDVCQGGKVLRKHPLSATAPARQDRSHNASSSAQSGQPSFVSTHIAHDRNSIA